MATSLDWYGCATFALRTAGLTIFLDAYVDRAAGAAGTGLTADDVDDCDWIVVRTLPLRPPLRRRADRPEHRRPDRRELRDRPHHGAGGRPGRPDDLRGRRGDGRAVRRRTRVGIPEPALVRVVARPDDAGRRGLPRRPRPHVAGTEGALREAARAPRRPGALVARAPPHGTAGRPGRRGRARLRLRDARRPALLPGHLRALVRHHARPEARRGDRGRRRSGEHRRGADPGLAGPVRGPGGRAAPAAARRALAP